jgi:lysophospholipase L1-like esterase
VVVRGQSGTDRVAGTLINAPGPAVVGHEFDGQVVLRWVSVLRHDELSTSEVALEVTNGGVSGTTRNDLLVDGPATRDRDFASVRDIRPPV